MQRRLKIALLIRTIRAAVLIIYAAKGAGALPAASCHFGVSVDQRLPPNFEGSIVYPQLDVDPSGTDWGRPFSTLNGSTGLHLKEVQVRLRRTAEGTDDHLLRLTLNQELLSKGLTATVNGRQIAKKPEACHYQGVCSRVGHEGEDSYAAVSTCHGLRGTFHADGLTFYIRPLDGSSPATGSAGCWPHLVMRGIDRQREGAQASQELAFLPPSPSCGLRSSSSLDDTGDGHGAAGAQWLPFQELHASEYSAKMYGSDSRPSSNQQAGAKTKKIALAAMVDRAFLLQKNVSEDDVVEYLLDVVNVVDRFYQPLGIRVMLSYCHVWRVRNEVAILPNARETLQNFLAYSQGKMRDYNVAAMITGQAFDDGLYGIAVPDSICSQRAVVVAHDGGSHTAQPHLLGNNLAHLIGHVIGLQHDGHECICSDEVGCLMKSTRSAPNEAPKRFSTCSAQRADTLARAELGACLAEEGKSPNSYQQFCGNGQIERGEQCDCGPPSKCHENDPCCDSSTCLLKPWATCRKGDCCKDCKPKSSASMCRPADGDCDVPEYCDGISGECPANLIVQDGQPCANVTEVCFRGQCRRRQRQCEVLWGADSVSAGNQCYGSLNVLGEAYGNCGLEPDYEEYGMHYRKCDIRDVLCGVLQCVGGSDKPRPRDRIKPYRRVVDAAGQTCKSLAGDTAVGVSATSGAVLVEDGTSCGEGHICLSQACVPLSTLVTQSCPRGGADNRPCSDKGVCTNKATCVCDTGYIGADCSIKLNTTASSSISLNASTTGTEQVPPREGIGTDDSRAPSLDVKWLVVIAVTIAIAVVAATLATIFCLRRRRGALSKQKAAQHLSSSLNGKPSSTAVSLSLLPSRSETPDERSERRRSGSSQLPSQYSDAEESDEADDENEAVSSTLVNGSALKIPEELYRQPARGILKKTSRLRERDDPFSSETCSCSDSDDDSSSTSWDGADREGPPIVHSLPRRPKSGSRGGSGGSSPDESDPAVPYPASGADESAAMTAAQSSSLTSPISVQVSQPPGRLLWQGSPLTHKALMSANVLLTEDSGNGTEASPGTSDDFGCGGAGSIPKVAATMAAPPPLPSFVELPGRSRSRPYAVPVPVPLPCVSFSRGMADGGCEADSAGAGTERSCPSSTATSARPGTPRTLPSLPGLAPIAPDGAANDRLGSGGSTGAALPDGSLSRRSQVPALARAELVGLNPARPLLNGQGEFVKQPSLTTFMPVPVKAVDSDPYSRTFAARPVPGPALTCVSMNGSADGHADPSTGAKRRPTVLDVRNSINWADS